MTDRPRVGEILVQAGIIDDMQLRSALGEQSRWGGRLGITLIKLGMVEEGHLIRALAKQLDLPVASLSGKKIGPEVVALVPASVASQHGVMPLFVKEGQNVGQLYLGMEDPSNLDVLEDLSFRTGMEVHPVMVGPTELREAIDRYYFPNRKPATASASSWAFDAAEGVDPKSASDLPDAAGETMGETNLRAVTGDPADASATTPSTPAPDDSATLYEPVEVRPLPPPRSAAPEVVLKLPDGLLDNVAKAVDDSERTRLVAKAIAQLLIEKGILSLEELQDKIAQMKAASVE